MEDDQIRSKQRVIDHGEVFTSSKEVNAMLDLVSTEAERIDSRFLEPACGTGNFLIEVLERKMNSVFVNYKTSRVECEKYLVIAVGSLYGIDLLPDNVEECRQKLLNKVVTKYSYFFNETMSENLEKTLSFILSKNIVCGDALNMCHTDGTSIVFSEWTGVTGSLIKRRDFSFSELVRASGKQTSLFDAGWSSEKKKAEFVPTPISNHAAIHYTELYKDD